MILNCTLKDCGYKSNTAFAMAPGLELGDPMSQYKKLDLHFYLSMPSHCIHGFCILGIVTTTFGADVFF